MRVWALASCSGLLALAACSAEQSGSPNPSAAPLDGEDAAHIKTQPGLTATSSSPMARPEVRPRQVIQGGYRLNSSPGKPASTTASSSEKTLPQAAELRARLERLRSQQGSRLSPSTPLVTAPQPAALARPNLSPPSPAEREIPAFNPAQSPTFSAEGISALPTPSRPTPTASAAADLGEAASASVARTYPIAPLRHQGYSARSQRLAPVLSVARAEAESPSTARLHGGILTAQQTESVTPEGATSSQVAIIQGSTFPEPNGSGASTASTGDSTPALVIRSETSAPAPLTAGNHQSSGTVALTPTSLIPNSLETSSEDHQIQGMLAEGETDPVGQAPVLWESSRAEGVIVSPESLPLNPPSPRPNLVRPQPTESAADPDSSTARINLPDTAAIAAPALPSSESTQPEATALGENSAVPELHHQSQLSPETVRLIPTASAPSKGLPIAYCLSPSGQLVPTTLEAQGSSASLPKFSSSSSADPSLDLDPELSKDDPADLCVGMSSSTPELATTNLSPTLN